MSRPSRGTELFGQRLRELRRKRGLTQGVVADRVGCSQSHLSTIEWGERVPNLLMIIRLALALECRVTELMGSFDRADLRSMLPETDAHTRTRRHSGRTS
jgi:transcriptional regulator with XRE-family HTH domain